MVRARIWTLAAALILAGCGKDDPVKPEPATPFAYPDRSTPQNAILRMASAFELRDSVVTADVYDDAYQGSSTDQADPAPVTLQFSKEDEVEIVASMAKSTTVVTIRVDLKLPSQWTRLHYASDPPGWATLLIPHWEVYVNDPALGEYSTSSSIGATLEFTLTPTAPDASSPTDTTWAIVRWIEIRPDL